MVPRSPHTDERNVDVRPLRWARIRSPHLGRYRLSEVGSEFSLNAVVFGGSLVWRTSTDAAPGPVGIRVGLVGGIPAVGGRLR